MNKGPRLYLVTDRAATGNRPLLEVVAQGLSGIAGTGLLPGDVAVQLREKDLEGRALLELARPLRDLTAAAGVGLYVNDRIDIALAVGADGVHLGGGSIDVAAAARIAGDLGIGVSAHGPEEVAAFAAAAGARVAFALLGPIHDTPSKRRFGPPLGTGAITAAAGATAAAAAIPRPDSTMQPSITLRSSARAACAMRTASRIPPDFASLIVTPCAMPAQRATSPSVWQSSST